MMDESTTQIEDLDEVKKPEHSVARWLQEIKTAKGVFQNYWKRCKEVDKAYIDDRGELDLMQGGSRKFNILWANHQTVKPSLYNGTPKPQVKRRHSDKDDVTRLASQLLERATSFCMEDYPFDSVLRDSVDDFFLYSRAVGRVVYEPTIAAGPDGMEYITNEEVRAEIVHVEDFLHSPARKWEDVRWVAFKTELNKMEAREKFGEIADELTYDSISDDDAAEDMVGDTEEADYFKKVCIWEIWDKDTRQQIIISPSLKSRPIEVNDDPLKLHEFFPCPRPMYATTKRNSLIPVPEYALWQDQAKELNEITGRISAMFKGIKLVGVAPGNFEEATQIFELSNDNEIVLIKNWQVLQQKGGLDRIIEFLPIDRNVQVLQTLYQQREQLVASIYELSGISDLMRGVNNPNATATAESTKAKYSGMRLQDKQQIVEEYARDLLSLKAEIIAEHFQDETIIQMAAGDLIISEVEKRMLPQAIQLLRNDRMRSFRMTIETNSTRAVDTQAEKQSAGEFTTLIGGFIQQIAPVAQQYPALLPFVRELLMFNARKHHAGRNLESALEGALDQLEQGQGVAQQQQAPDPTTIKMQAEMQKFQAQQQIRMQEMQAEVHEAASKLEIEREKLAGEMQVKLKELELKERELALKEAEFGMKQQEHMQLISPVPVMKPFEMRATVDPETGERVYTGVINA